MRASIAAESAGIPSVSVVCEGFVTQAAATGRGHGYNGLPLAIMPGHVDAQSVDVMLSNLRDVTVDQVIAGLTEAVSSSEPETQEPTTLDVAASGTIDEINRTFIAKGWSDGSPIIPPTRDRVEQFIAVTAHDPWRRIGIAPSSGRDVTIWSIAVNAVMAGCEPAHLPVLIAVAMIIDGPSSVDLGFNHGQGAMRDGHPANTTIGRWLRLFLRNVFGFTPDEHDKATFGNSARVVLAEDMVTLADIGWQPLSADFGFDETDDVVTMARMNSGAIIGSVFGSTPDEIVPYLADGLARISGWDLTHVYGLGTAQYRPLLVLAPLLARTFARAGWSKDDVRNALFEHARVPAWRFEKLIGEWTNLTPGRRTLIDLAAAGDVPAVFAESDDSEREVPIVTDPSKFAIAVAGDPTRTNAYVFSNDGPHGDWTTRSIDRSSSKDLVCGNS